MASVIDMTFLYDAGYLVVLLKQKNEVKPLPKVQKIGFVWGNGLYQPGGFYCSGFRKAQNVQIFQGVRLLPKPSLKKLSTNGQGAGGKIK